MGIITNLDKRHCFFLAAAFCSLASPAYAMFVCTDEWGGSYLLEQVLNSGSSNLKCVPSGASQAGSAKPAAVNKIALAATALGLPTPIERVPAGDLSMAVVPGIAVTPATKSADTMEPLEAMINDIAYQYGHDANLLKAIIHVESRFNANAVSPKGAIGLMQVMPSTGTSVGIEEPKRTLFDPKTNIRAGAKYLRILLDKFSDRPELAIAAYNAGENAVMRYNRDIPPYPETQSYVRQVLAQYSIYQKQ
jgi:soluble lytic murein transglycosylase-like protein